MHTAVQHNEGYKTAARTYEANRSGSTDAHVRAMVGAKMQKMNTVPTHKKIMPEQTNSVGKTAKAIQTDETTVTDKSGKTDNTEKAGKELKRMSRSELIEVIYALEKDLEELKADNEKLHSELDDKDIRIATSGSIAEAALSLNHIFEDAQAAADQYLNSIKHRHISTKTSTQTSTQTASTSHARHAL